MRINLACVVLPSFHSSCYLTLVDLIKNIFKQLLDRIRMGNHATITQPSCCKCAIGSTDVRETAAFPRFSYDLFVSGLGLYLIMSLIIDRLIRNVRGPRIIMVAL